jgi:hypothetical protein
MVRGGNPGSTEAAQAALVSAESQIAQTPGYVVIVTQSNSEVRVVPLDGRPHLPSGVRQWLGDSRGRWEGDTLVVDVRHFTDRTWFDRSGNFHSAALHVVERYTPITPYHINYEATIEDPKVFTRPWKVTLPLYRRIEKNIRVLDYECYAFGLERTWYRPPE